ncbi:MAG: hypothetical protein HY830_02385 [Actinobacteria bacterium]|nr:hypothetical protein [Actinomycetota bacterium]
MEDIMMNGYYGMGSGGVLMWLTSLLIVAALVWLVVRFAVPGSTRGSGGRERPEDVLDRRFAAGEIDADTYKSQRAALVEARKNR